MLPADPIEQPGQTLRMVVAIDLRHVVVRPVLGRTRGFARELDQSAAIDSDRLADLLLCRVERAPTSSPGSVINAATTRW